MVAAADVNVAVETESVVGLIGANGAGKTTFINMVTGYLKPSSGSIRCDGHELTALAPRRVTQLGVSRSFQIPQLFNTLSTRENLLAAVGIVAAAAHAWAHSDLAPQRSGAATDEMLERFGLAPYRDRPAGLLPEGVRKLLDVAMALVVKPRLLLLDEPTSGVSADEKFAIMDLVMGAVRGVTVLFVEHDMDIVATLRAARARVRRRTDHRRRRAGGRAARPRGAPLRDRGSACLGWTHSRSRSARWAFCAA